MAKHKSGELRCPGTALIADSFFLLIVLAPLVPPPTYDEVVDREPTRREAQTSNSLPKLEEEEAKEALSEFLAEKSCCCSGVDGSELKFTDLRQSCAHHVRRFEFIFGSHVLEIFSA